MQRSSTSDLHIPGLSDSPASSPMIVEGPESPIKSIHLEMEQDRAEEEPGMRTIDFFDNTSDSEPSDQVAAGGIPIKRHSIGSSVQGLYNGSQGNSSHLKHLGEFSADNSKLRKYLELTSSGGDESSTSHLAPSPRSLDEGTTEAVASEARPISIRDAGPGRLVNHASPRVSSYMGSQYGSSRLDKSQQILELHAITLQALTRDEETLQTTSPRIPKDRQSVPDAKELRHLPPLKPAKRVTVIPPPLSVSDPTGQSPMSITRTPYPFAHRKVFPPMSPVSENSEDTISRESVLSVCIRRRNVNRPARVSRMVLPKSAELRSPGVASADSNEKHFRSLDYDDSHFFQQMRSEYISLRGSFRYLSAQTLQRITVEYFGYRSGRPVRCNSCDHVESEAMRSPRLLAFKGLEDTFSEEKLMEHYRNPKAGRARYSWVHWAHRIAASAAPALSKIPITPPPPGSAATDTTLEEDSSKANNDDAANKGDAEEAAKVRSAAEGYEVNSDEAADDNNGVGIEFIEDWSVSRIAIALIIVFALAVAATLLWTFLGVGPALADGNVVTGGVQSAGVRVAAGFIFGVFVFLIGLAVVIAWAWVSWLVT